VKIFSKKLIIFPLLSFFLTMQTTINLKLKSENLINSQENNSSLLLEETITSSYILGPYDSISINFEGVPLFSKIYFIDEQGEIFLPELKRFSAGGKTIKELENLLQEKYKPFIIDPKISINISEYRPVKVYLGGELKKPGLYTLNNLPRLFDAIKSASGLTQYSNLEDIEIIRKNSLSQGGGKIKTSINLLSLLENGDQSINIRIFDGDYIFVKKSSELISKQLRLITRTNINPDQISVFVTGNVPNPGLKSIPSDSTIRAAIASAGGKLDLSGQISLVRFSHEGKAKKRIFKINKNSEKGSYDNPILMHSDIINVNKNILGNITSTLNNVAAPLVTSYGIYSLFD